MKFKINLLIILAVFVLTYSCKKTDRTPINAEFYKMTTEEIKTVLFGKWRNRFFRGALAIEDRNKYNEYYEFSTSNMLNYYFRDSLKYQDEMRLRRDTTLWNQEFYYRTIIQLRNNPTTNWYDAYELNKVQNDTLIMALGLFTDPDVATIYLTK